MSVENEKNVEEAVIGKGDESGKSGEDVETGKVGKSVEGGKSGKGVEAGKVGKSVEDGEGGKSGKDVETGKDVEDGGGSGATASEPFEGTIQFRVRYAETDQMGVVYHGNYFTYFEMGRTELLREATGVSYRDVEESATKMVVVKAECNFMKPAKYDDLLTLKTRVLRTTRASLEHEYRLFRDGELLAVGKTKLATVDNSGKIVPVPDWIKNLARPRSGEAATK